VGAVYGKPLLPSIACMHLQYSLVPGWQHFANSGIKDNGSLGDVQEIRELCQAVGHDPIGSCGSGIVASICIEAGD
jgi:hypothetical protein